MSGVIVNAALRHAARAARNGSNILVYSNGGDIVLVVNAIERGGKITGECATRKVSSAAMARAVVARYVGDLHMFTHLSAASTLDASIAYAQAAWRHANRRAGRRMVA